MRGPFDRRRWLVLAAAALFVIASTAVSVQETMSEEPWSHGGIAGTLARPAKGPARGPAVLLLAGSGGSPRDGSFGTLRQIAEGLAAAGIRSLRYDKRGVGESRALVTREDDLTFDLYVDDAAAAARELAGRSEVSSVVIAGHSEGALLAILAAAKVPAAGIVSLAGTGRKLDAVLREQLQNIPAPEPLRSEAFQILDRLAAGERVSEVPRPHWPLFRPSVQPFLLSVFAVDPGAALARVTVPVLVVSAGRDLQVTRADFDLLTKAKPNARTLVLPDANHVFKLAPADLSNREAQLKSYDPAAPLVPALVPALIDFVRSVAR